MTHVPMCLNCGVREVVGEFTDMSGNGFCGRDCQDEMLDLWDAEEEYKEHFDSLLASQYYDDERAERVGHTWEYNPPSDDVYGREETLGWRGSYTYGQPLDIDEPTDW